jgi:hypothetical protein
MTQATVIPAPRTVFAVTWIPVLAYGAVLTMPAFLAVLGKSYGMSSSELGSLASAEWFACIAGTYFANSRSIGELSRWVLWACAVAVAVNLAGAILAGRVALIYFHPLSTFGAGIAYGYALKVFDASRQQQRNYGIFLAVVNVSELVIFQLINYLTVAYSKAAVFVVYASLALGAVLVTAAVVKPLASLGGTEAGTASSAATRLRRPRPIVLFSVVALGVSYASFGMTWPFVQLMGVAHGLSPLEVTNGTSAYSITGIMGALAAAVLPSRINRSAVLSLALIALFASVYLLYVAPGSAWFLLGCSIFGFYWTFYCTSHVSLIAKADSTGRAIVFCGMAPSLGAIVGSFWGGRLIEGTNYLPTAEVGLALAVVGIAATLYTLAQKQPPDESSSLAAASRGHAEG